MDNASLFCLIPSLLADVSGVEDDKRLYSPGMTLYRQSFCQSKLHPTSDPGVWITSVVATNSHLVDFSMDILSPFLCLDQ